MTLTIELTAEEARRVEQAKQKGFDVEAMLHGVIAGLPPIETRSADDKTLELFAQWRAETEAMTPEEIAAEDEGWDEILDNIQHNGLHLHVPDVTDHD